MGIIRKQTIAGTVYTYLGVLIGFLTTGIIMPRILSTDQVGLLNLLIAYSGLLATFANAGTMGATIRDFAFYRDDDKEHNGFLFNILIINLGGAVLCAAVYFIFRDMLAEASVEKSAIFAHYMFYLIPFTLAVQFFNVFDVYHRVLYLAVRPTMLKEFLQRALILVALGVYWFFGIDFDYMVLMYFLAVLIPTVLLVTSLIGTKQLHLRPNKAFLTPERKKSLLSVCSYGIVTTVSGMLLYNIDTIMVNHYLGVSQAGIYSIAFFFGTLVVMPSRMLKKIAGTVISESWVKGDMSTVQSVYTKSSITQSAIGVFLLLGMWVNIDNIYEILPAEYAAGAYVILFIGLANLIDMTTGVAGVILSISEAYRYYTLFALVLIASAVGFNIILIPIWGLAGAAIAAMFSLLIFGAIQMQFLWSRYRLQPFIGKHLLLVITAALAYLAAWLVPVITPFYVDLFVRSTVLTVVFAGLMYILEVSEDANKTVGIIINRLRG